MSQQYVFLFLILLLYLCKVDGVAKFEIVSVSDSSIIVRMIKAANVSRFEMAAVIYDLDSLHEFRRTELTASRNDDHLYSFDGLKADTWFCIRFNYRLFYKSRDGTTDFQTKQELIARTKNNSQLSPSIIDDQIIFIYGAVSDVHSVNLTVGAVFASRPKISTLVVPELQCDRARIKPNAKRLNQYDTIHFDLRKAYVSNTVHLKPSADHGCSRLCVFPFIRAEITNVGQETFRGKEWCGTIQEAEALITSSHANCPPVNVILSTFFCILFMLL